MKSFAANDPQQNCISSITDELNRKITDKTLISELLNNFFTNIGSNMDSKIPKAAKSYHCPGFAQSFVFDKITEEEVLAQIRLLNPNKAAGPKNIPIKFLKAIATIISPNPGPKLGNACPPPPPKSSSGAKIFTPSDV